MDSDIDWDRVDDAVLALLSLGLSKDGYAWKSFDWDAMDRLYQKGMIDNPVSKAKSVWMTPEGIARAEQLFQKLFGRR